MLDSFDMSPQSRREFFRASAAAAALFGGLGVSPALAQQAMAVGASEKPLKAAFSNAGLQATWCAQGKQAAEYWGKLFNVEVTWLDGQLDAVKQRAAIDNMASQEWDFVAIQAFGIGTQTPLWYYLLREAEIATGGRHLGPVGAAIVAEVFVGLLKADPESVLVSPTPELPSESGRFMIADLFRFIEACKGQGNIPSAGVINPLA